MIMPLPLPLIRLALATAVAAFVAGGCGYANSVADTASGYTNSSLYRQDVRTVAVPVFSSKSYVRGVEFQLTTAIVQQIESTTPYKVVPSERADTILEGQVVDVGVSSVSNDSRAAIPQEQLFKISVNFTWKDLRTGRVMVERRNFEQTSTFYPTIAEGRWAGSQQAAEQLARGIVQELQADW